MIYYSGKPVYILSLCLSGSKHFMGTYITTRRSRVTAQSLLKTVRLLCITISVGRGQTTCAEQLFSV